MGPTRRARDAGPRRRRRARREVHGRSRSRTAEAIGPNARLAVVAGAGHAVSFERPEAFVALLRRVPPPRRRGAAPATGLTGRSRARAGRRTTSWSVPVATRAVTRSTALGASEHAAKRAAGPGRRREGRSGRAGRQKAITTTNANAADHASRVEAVAWPPPPRRTARVFLPACLSRLDVAQVVDHEQRRREQADGDGRQNGEGGDAPEAEIGGADDGDEAEEDEDEDLAEARVAVGARARRCRTSRRRKARRRRRRAATASWRARARARPRRRRRRRRTTPPARPRGARGPPRRAAPGRPARCRCPARRRSSRWRSSCRSAWRAATMSA